MPTGAVVEPEVGAAVGLAAPFEGCAVGADVGLGVLVGEGVTEEASPFSVTVSGFLAVSGYSSRSKLYTSSGLHVNL